MASPQETDDTQNTGSLGASELLQAVGCLLLLLAAVTAMGLQNIVAATCPLAATGGMLVGLPYYRPFQPGWRPVYLTKGKKKIGQGSSGLNRKQRAQNYNGRL